MPSAKNRYNNNNKIKSQRLINAMLAAKRENESITMKELEYVAFGFRNSQKG